MERHIQKAEEDKDVMEDNMALLENQYENLKFKHINLQSK